MPHDLAFVVCATRGAACSRRFYAAWDAMNMEDEIQIGFAAGEGYARYAAVAFGVFRTVKRSAAWGGGD